MIGKSQIRSPPPSNEPRAIAPALCQNRSQDDPPPLSQVTFTQQFKGVFYTMSVPRRSKTKQYKCTHLHVCCFVLLRPFFLICFSLFWKSSGVARGRKVGGTNFFQEKWKAKKKKKKKKRSQRRKSARKGIVDRGGFNNLMQLLLHLCVNF